MSHRGEQHPFEGEGQGDNIGSEEKLSERSKKKRRRKKDRLEKSNEDNDKETPPNS